MRQRITGYREALHAAGIESDPSLLSTGTRDVAGARSRGRPPARAPRRRPTALFTANNRNTIGALHALADVPARSPSPASTTSSSPTCSAPPSSAPTRGSSASRAPRSPSPASTATSAHR